MNQNAQAVTATENPPAKSGKRQLFLVDASGYIFRAYHALPPLTRPDGVPVGAVYGYVNMMLKIIDGVPDDEYVAVIFDMSRKTFRSEIYPEYKAHRPPAPEDLVPQFAIVREATLALGLPVIEMEGFEADDLIASYACEGKRQGFDVTIVSSDKDLMQLVGDGVSMLEPIRQKPIGRAEVIEKFGVPPELVVDAQSLIGDSTDNVPGVPGIGPKTAAELILEFGSLEGVLANTHNIKQNKRRESLIEFAEQARISRRLVELRCDVPLPVPVDQVKLRAPNPDVLMPFLHEQGFKTLTARVADKYGMHGAALAAKEASNASDKPTIETHYELVSDMAALKRWIADAEYVGQVAFDTETTGLDAMQVDMVGVSLSVEPGKACYIPVGHVEEGALEAQVPAASQIANQGDLFSENPAPLTVRLREGQLPLKAVIEALKPMLENPAVLKIGQNVKYDMQILRRCGINVSPVEDTMLLSYVLSAGLNGHGMDELAGLHLNMSPISYAAVTGTGRNKKNFSEVELAAARDYAAEDADVTLRLQQHLKPKLIEQKLVSVYETIERPLIPVLLEMESHGIKVNRGYLQALSKDFAERIAKFEIEIFKLAGREFTVGSPKQLGEILFDELKLPGGKKSAKSGAYATGADVLEELVSEGHTIAARVLDWRQLSKLKSTYTDALDNQINPKTGRVHTCYAMAIASTGRLSSSDPNLQNIPIRTEEGKKIRDAFIAEPGNKLISADYSQIELRLLAHMADIDVLRDAFRNGADIHAATASQMFGVPLSEVNSDLRRKAKTINFGIIYGISAHGLAVRLGINRREAADYIEAYFRQYPGIKAYMEKTIAFAREHGYVPTLYGRRVHVKDINAKNPNFRNFSERAAINAPLQGTAADIIKKAMIAVHRLLKTQFPQARMLLQVHDELVIEAPEAQAEAVSALLRQTMSAAAQLSVPLTVDVGVGDNWGQIH